MSVVAGEYKQSYELYEQALSVEPHSASLHYNLGNTLMDLAIQSDVSLLRRSVTHYVECLSAEATYPGAMYNLADCYEKGTGVDKNLPEARRFYQMAADAGDENAVEDAVEALAHLAAAGH